MQKVNGVKIGIIRGQIEPIKNNSMENIKEGLNRLERYLGKYA